MIDSNIREGICRCVNSFFSSVCYSLADALVDPGDEWKAFCGVKTVLLTHAHFDHIYGLNRLIEISPEVRVYTNEHGRVMLLNDKKNMSRYHETPFVFQHPERIVIVNDGDEVELGDGFIAKAVFTPGHNPSCITWIIGDCLFTGDSYIPRIKTVTNLSGGDKKQSEDSIKLIKNLAVGRTIYPGHKI